jgi:hypothetical protein
VFLGLLDPDPNPLVTGTDPDPDHLSSSKNQRDYYILEEDAEN